MSPAIKYLYILAVFFKHNGGYRHFHQVMALTPSSPKQRAVPVVMLKLVLGKEKKSVGLYPRWMKLGVCNRDYAVKLAIGATFW